MFSLVHALEALRHDKIGRGRFTMSCEGRRKNGRIRIEVTWSTIRIYLAGVVHFDTVCAGG